MMLNCDEKLPKKAPGLCRLHQARRRARAHPTQISATKIAGSRKRNVNVLMLREQTAGTFGVGGEFSFGGNFCLLFFS